MALVAETFRRHVQVRPPGLRVAHIRVERTRSARLARDHAPNPPACLAQVGVHEPRAMYITPGAGGPFWAVVSFHPPRRAAPPPVGSTRLTTATLVGGADSSCGRRDVIQLGCIR